MLLDLVQKLLFAFRVLVSHYVSLGSLDQKGSGVLVLGVECLFKKSALLFEFRESLFIVLSFQVLVLQIRNLLLVLGLLI